MKKVAFSTCFALLYLLVTTNTFIYARSGCCSHHGGVCGCSCCDGSSLSDTCAPYYPECSKPINYQPVATKVPSHTLKLITSIPEVKSITAEATKIPINTPTALVSSSTKSSDTLPTLLGFGFVGTMIYLGLKSAKKQNENKG